MMTNEAMGKANEAVHHVCRLSFATRHASSGSIVARGAGAGKMMAYEAMGTASELYSEFAEAVFFNEIPHNEIHGEVVARLGWLPPDPAEGPYPRPTAQQAKDLAASCQQVCAGMLGGVYIAHGVQCEWANRVGVWPPRRSRPRTVSCTVYSVHGSRV